MARYKRRILDTDSGPGLFDDIESHVAPGQEDFPVFPALSHHAEQKLREKELEKTPQTGTHAVEPLAPVANPDKLKFISFGSGSSGNCAYLGDDNSGILIDAGIDGDKVTAELWRHGIRMSSVKGIILTHDHGDHIRYVYNILRKNRHIALYCTPKAFNGIMRRHNISRRLKDYHHPIYKEIPFKVDDFEITAFEVSHDGTDNAGFFISHGDFHLSVATDLGCIGPRVDYYMRQSEFIIIESNYDRRMLIEGAYPEYLKARIMASNGHLDNEVTAAYLAEIYRPGIRYVFLCHLSHDNNTPATAINAVTQALRGKGISVGDGSETYEARRAPLQVMALPRYDSTGVIVLRLD